MNKKLWLMIAVLALAAIGATSKPETLDVTAQRHGYNQALTFATTDPVVLGGEMATLDAVASRYGYYRVLDAPMADGAVTLDAVASRYGYYRALLARPGYDAVARHHGYYQALSAATSGELESSGNVCFEGQC